MAHLPIVASLAVVFYATVIVTLLPTSYPPSLCPAPENAWTLGWGGGGGVTVIATLLPMSYLPSLCPAPENAWTLGWGGGGSPSSLPSSPRLTLLAYVLHQRMPGPWVGGGGSPSSLPSSPCLTFLAYVLHQRMPEPWVGGGVTVIITLLPMSYLPSLCPAPENAWTLGLGGGT